MMTTKPMSHKEFRALRLLAGMTQADVGRELGVTAQAIWRKELPPDNPDCRGITKLQADAVRRLAMSSKPT